MAGEAASSTSVTLAFQKKRNAEWCKLRKHLHFQLQQDIARIYTNSLYCDLELVFDSASVKTHSSILQVRAARFFTHLCNKSVLASAQNDIYSLAFEKASSDYIKDFVRNVYSKCAIAEEESDIVQYLESINEPCTATKSRSLTCRIERGASQDSGLSPESDIYLTPNCSPSDFCHIFCKEQHQKVSAEINNTYPEAEDEITNLHKTNRSYYTIVAVDEVFREETVAEHLEQKSELNGVLERELAEQDELLKSFKSIKSKEEKKVNRPTRKINKPTSLPVSSSLYTKKQKRGCDVLHLKDQRKENNISEFRQLPSCSNSSKPFTYKESNIEYLKKGPPSKSNIFVGKFNEKQNLGIAEDKTSSLQPSQCCLSFTKDVDVCSKRTKNILHQNVEEEEFICSPKGEGHCGLRCCQDKDDDLLTLTPCSPEMDASGGGPDSGLDTCSTGCVPGGGFNSPREHTVSETSGVDLTEAAIGEDMPHDGESELNLPKPSKSSDSSSVSSEAGTWDTTFPPSSTIQDLQNPRTKTENDTLCQEVTENKILGECMLANIESSQNYISSASDNASCMTPDTIIKGGSAIEAARKQTNIPRETDSNHGQKTNVHCDDHQGEHSLKYENMNDTFDVSTSDAFNESNASEILTDSCDTDMVKHRRKVSSLGDLQSEYLVDSHQPTSGEKCNDWKIDTSVGASNNYFINAATLVDDSELPTSLPPLYIHETTHKVKESSNRRSDREDLSFCDLSTKTPTSSPTEIQEEDKHLCVSLETVMVSEPLKLSTLETMMTEDINENSEPTSEKEQIDNNTHEMCASSNNEPTVMRVTFLKMGGTRHEVKLLNGQDLFAEFQKELRVTEHLEPQIVRKIPGGKFKWDSENLSNEHPHSENDIIIDNSVAAIDDIQEKHETETVNENESSHMKELEDDEQYSNNRTEKPKTQVSDDRDGEDLEKSPEEESEDMEAPRRSSLIRRNTFELDPDEEHIALLRQEYERRQGNLLFQNCIPQFSGHITGSEGFRDAQSLLVLGTENGGDMHKSDEQQMSLPGIPIGDSLMQMSVVDADTSLPCQVQSAMSVDESCSNQQFSNFQNENIVTKVTQPLNCIVKSVLQAVNGEMKDDVKAEESNENLEYYRVQKVEDENIQTEYDAKEHSFKNGSSGFTRQSSYDIACKPVISGALTCSDLGIEDKRSWDSPKKHQKRTESTPIVSGGVSTVDFSLPVRKVSESPIMRRKNETAPILSGAAPVSPEQKEVSDVKPQPSASAAAAWVVDMSDCTGNAAKPPLDSRKHKKSDSTSGFQHLQGSQDVKDEPSTGPVTKLAENKNSSSLGFFVDLKVSPGREQPDLKLKEKRENIHDARLQKSLESTPVNVGYFVGFEGSRPHSREKWDRKSSSFEERREFKRQSSKSDENKSSGKNSPCGFFVDLTNKEKSASGTKDTESKRLSSEDEKDTGTPDRKSAIFSMFIDIGDTKKDSAGRHGSAESVKSKVASSPLLSSNKKLGLRRASLSRDSSDRGSRPNSATFDIDDQLPLGESPKSTFMYIDANTPSSKSEGVIAQSQPSSLEEVSEHKGSKKQSFFMFIENESPVIRRKTLPSGLRPSFNRHSWNPETRSALQAEDARLTARRQHKRAHSVSVDRSSICSPGDEHKSSSSSSLAKAQQQGSSHSLCESAMPPDVGMPQMSVSCHARLSSKSQEKFLQHTFSVEEQMEDDGNGNVIQTNEGGSGCKIEVAGNVNVKFTVKEAKINVVEIADLENAEELELRHATQVSVQDRSASKRSIPLDSASMDVGKHRNDKEGVKVPNDDRKLKKMIIEGEHDSSHALGDENFSKHTQELANGVTTGETDSSRKAEFISEMQKGEISELKKREESSNGSFVRLSDLDKEPAKTHDVSDSSDILPSFSATNRMTRSIPETSWIENKLLMTRSIGSGSTSKSLSRLFPHLHTGGSASSSPSSATYSKSPGGQVEVDDNDMQVSETSDLSSMQSSMGPSGLGSTEETDASSSYAGRSGPVSRLGEDLLRMFLEEINPDVTVEVGGRRLKAHKCILSSRCQYFAAMLSGGWVESAGNVISLQGFSYNAVHFALCHIYSGTSNIPDTISIVELATLADMLGLEGLKEVIMYTLKVKYCHFFHKPCTMCTVGVLECLPLAAAYGLDEIYRKSLRWITKYFVRIWPTKGFASLPRELVEKCYQQHVVHMSVDNVLETVMCCDKLLATLPNVRWAEPVFGITSQLLEASIKYIANNFSGVLTSENFLSLGKELSWNISRLEDSIMAATDRLPPDQCCQSYSRLHQILFVARSSEPPSEMQWSQNFVELLSRIQKRVEASLVRQAPRAARCQSWGQMEPELRRKIQEIACLVLVPGEDHRSRLSNIAKRSASGGSVYCTGPRSASSSGLRSLDLRQVRLAMTQQARRAASGGRVSTLKADNKAKAQAKQPQATQVKKETATTDDSSKASNGETSVRPKTWPMRVLENKSRSTKYRVNSSNSSTGTPEKSNSSAPRRSGKNLISSSDSSRTSSPAMRRSAPGSDSSGRVRASTLGSTSGRNVVNRSDTPPGRDMRNRRKKEGEITAMSTDSLTESPSNGSAKRSAKELSESATSRSCQSTRPDTPSVRRKVREEVVMSTDSLSSAANGEKAVGKECTSMSAPNHSSITTRPETPKDRKKNALGRLGIEVTISTDSLATDSSYADVSVGGKESGKVSGGSNRNESKAGKLVKISNVKNESQRSPASAVRKITRQSVSSPRDSPTTRIRSAVSSSPYTGSPSLRRSLLLASKPENIPSTASGKQSTPSKATTVVKSEKLTTKLLASPSTSTTKRTPTRNITRGQVVASPAKPVVEGFKCGAGKCAIKESVSTCTPNKTVSNKISIVTKKTTNGSITDGRNKRYSDCHTKLPSVSKREAGEDKPPSVGSRSGTFLKDEPTILKKPDINNVQE